MKRFRRRPQHERSEAVVPEEAEPVEPYEALAEVYDLVMSHVDYVSWARYIHALMDRHGLKPHRVLELGCGTGSIGLGLMQVVDGLDYVGLDRAPRMVDVARARSASLGLPARWVVADFRRVADQPLGAPFDAVLLLFDGLNYAIDPGDVALVFEGTRGVLRTGGLVLVDQSTPANSERNASHFNDRGGDETFRYIRRNSYDTRTRLNRTVFEINRTGRSGADQRFVEEHVQRAYEVGEIRPLLEAAGFEVEAVYKGFTYEAATGESERVQWVARALGGPDVGQTAAR